MQLHPNTIKACKELMHRDMIRLTGPKNADRRQRAMQLIIGEKISKSASGINSLRIVLMLASEIKTLAECEAVKDAALEAWINHVGSFEEMPTTLSTKFGTVTFVNGEWRLVR